MSIEEKKKRGKNFNSLEEQVLLELLEERRNVLENKKSDAATWKQKEQAWEEMADAFYARTGIRREWRALKDKFINMKRRSKTDQGEEKGHIIRVATGLTHKFDSDVSNVQNEMNYEGEDDMFESSMDDQDFPSLTASKNALIDTTTHSEWPSLNPRTLRSLDEEKIKLVLLQQEFYKGENQRAQAKHDHEMLKERIKLDQEVQEGKLRLELMELDIMAKRARLDLN